MWEMRKNEGIIEIYASFAEILIRFEVRIDVVFFDTSASQIPTFEGVQKGERLQQFGGTHL